MGSGPIGVDASIFIYFVERNPTYVDQVRPLFRSAESDELKLVTSALTLLEVLVVPLRAGNFLLAERYEALLTRGRGLRMVEIDRFQLRAAAELRAVHRVRTPDALQLAAALSAGCSAFVTNDRRLATPAGLRIVQLADHV
ncbi:PIN domain-containing protein [soil metagenome]